MVTTNLQELLINYLTQAQYDNALAVGTIDENQLYFISDKLSGTNIITSTSQPLEQSVGDYWYHVTGTANI